MLPSNHQRWSTKSWFGMLLCLYQIWTPWSPLWGEGFLIWGVLWSTPPTIYLPWFLIQPIVSSRCTCTSFVSLALLLMGWQCRSSWRFWSSWYLYCRTAWTDSSTQYLDLGHNWRLYLCLTRQYSIRSYPHSLVITQGINRGCEHLHLICRMMRGDSLPPDKSYVRKVTECQWRRKKSVPVWGKTIYIWWYTCLLGLLSLVLLD